MSSKDLKGAGLKVTVARSKILEVLETSSQKHLSAEGIFNKLRAAKQEIALATVYRVLTQFEAAGIVARHNFEGDHAVFELTSEQHHDHLVCVKCGKVVEFCDPVIEEQQLTIAQKNEFTMTDHCLYIYGICKACN